MNRTVWLEEVFPIIEEQLDAGGIASLPIHGVSMMPMLVDGVDLVRIMKPTAEPKKYDVVLYRRDDGQFVLHRIVGVGKEGYSCRGDNQIANEYPVKRESIIGVVTDFTSNGIWKAVDSSDYKRYAWFRVNTVVLRRIATRIHKFFERKEK